MSHSRLRTHGQGTHGQGKTPPLIAGTWLPVVAAVLIAIHLGIRIWLVARGNFYWDDLVLVSRASEYSILSSDYLARSHDGHFMPAAFLLAGASTATAPLQWWLPALTLVILQLIASLAVWRMIRILAPRARIGALAALAFYLFTPMTIPAFIWWSAGLNALPMQAGLAYVIGSMVVIARGKSGTTGLPADLGRVRDTEDSLARGSITPRWLTSSTILAYLVALTFFEKSLLIVPVAFAVAVLVRRLDAPVRGPSDGAAGGGYRTWFASIVAVACSARRLWASLTVLTVVWAVLYWFAARPTAGSHSLGQTSELVWRSLTHGIVPALAGGPWSWERWNPSPPMALASGAGQLAGWAVLAVGIGVALWTRRGAGAVIAFAVTYVMLAQTAVMWNRSGPNTAVELAQALRYLPDSAVLIAVAIAVIAAAPKRIPAGLESVGVSAPWSRIRLLAAPIGLLLTCSALVSTISYSNVWRDNPTGAYVDTAKRSLAARPELTIFDQEVPLEVLLPLQYPNNRLSAVFGRVRPRPTFSSVTEQLWVLDPRGNLVPGNVTRVRSVAAGDGNCRRPPPATQRMRLDGPLIEWTWVVGFSYCADRDGEIELSLGAGDPVRVAVRAGLHPVYVQLSGGGVDLRVTERTPGLHLHTGAGQIGLPVIGRA